jgi:hypothetical protein
MFENSYYETNNKIIIAKTYLTSYMQVYIKDWGSGGRISWDQNLPFLWDQNYNYEIKILLFHEIESFFNFDQEVDTQKSIISKFQSHDCSCD